MIRNYLRFYRVRWMNRGGLILVVFLISLFVYGKAYGVVPLDIDICGCKGSPSSLGAFDTANPATFPAGAVRSADGLTLEIPLPPDGVLIFDSFVASTPSTTPIYVAGTGYFYEIPRTIKFRQNEKNTPVKILVAGNVTIESGVNIDVSGAAGESINNSSAPLGGLGGPGGFRGGDAAYQYINFTSTGGPGMGPGGGAPGIASTSAADTEGENGLFAGGINPDAFIGGSGGGGGASVCSSVNQCSGGAGGGGGGAILIAANGVLTLNGSINANGGAGGYGYTYTYNGAGSGGHGSGGVIRLIANIIAGTGSISAVSTSTYYGTDNSGAVSQESFENTFRPDSSQPVAYRLPYPGALASPLMPTLDITSINGVNVISHNGGTGKVDMIMPAPGLATIGLSTTNVPAGTTIDVRLKPKVGGAQVNGNVALSNCDSLGACSANITFDMPTGVYFVEAQATFQPAQ